MECPSAAAIRKRIAEHLRREIASTPGISAHGVVSSPADAATALWKLELEIRGPTGEDTRSLTGESCQALAEAAAFTLALMLEPNLVSATAAPRALAPPVEPVPTVIAKAPRTTATVRVHSRMGMLAGIHFGALPGIAGLVGVRVGIMGRVLTAELRGIYGTPTKALSSSDPAVGVRVQFGAVGLLGCTMPRIRDWSFPTCAGIEAGAVRGDGLGLEQRNTVHRPWLAVLVGGGVRVQTTKRMAFGIELQAVIPVFRFRFVTQNVGPVHEIGPAGVRAQLSWEVRLGRANKSK